MTSLILNIHKPILFDIYLTYCCPFEHSPTTIAPVVGFMLLYCSNIHDFLLHHKSNGTVVCVVVHIREVKFGILIGSGWPQMRLGEPKCTETDIKKSQICFCLNPNVRSLMESRCVVVDFGPSSRVLANTLDIVLQLTQHYSKHPSTSHI